MKRNLYSLVLVLALATAYSVAQMPTQEPHGGTGQHPPQPTHPGEATQPTPGQQAPGEHDPWGQEEARPEADEATVDDQQLEQQVREQFQADPALRGIEVRAENGEVHLEGTVASKDEKRRAKDMAKNVAGVRKVRDRALRVDANFRPDDTAPGIAAPPEQPQQEGMEPEQWGTQPDQEQDLPQQDPLHEDPQQQDFPQQDPIQEDPAGVTQPEQPVTPGITQPTEPGMEQICVQVDERTVYVVGTIHSEQDKQRIQQQLQQIHGVQVDFTHLRVEQTMQPGITQPGEQPDTLPQEDRPIEEQPHEEHPEGVTDPQQQEGIAAPEQDDPYGTEQQQPMGTEQQDQLGTQAETEQLQNQIQSALRNEPTLAQRNVNVNVTNGTVELSGSVRTGQERQTAKRIAESFAGHREVNDNLTVTGMGPERGIGHPQAEPEHDPQHEEPEQLPEEDREDPGAYEEDPALRL